MKIREVEEFEDHIAPLLDSEEAVILTRNGKPVGYYLPADLDTMPRELRMRLFHELTEQTRMHLEAQGITEEQVLAEFEAARKDRS